MPHAFLGKETNRGSKGKGLKGEIAQTAELSCPSPQADPVRAGGLLHTL